MIRAFLFAAIVKLATLAAGPAPALAPAPAADLIRPAFGLAEAMPETVGRACFGAGGRIVPCRRIRPLR